MNGTFPKAFLNFFLKLFIPLVLILSPLMFTLSDYGITSDEPIYQEAAWEIKKWLTLPPGKMFDPDEINRYWKTDPGRNVHPSGTKWMYLIAQKAILWEENPYGQNSILNIIIFSISLVIFLNWWAGGSIYRCCITTALLLLMPRFFAHAHFPATDIPMTSLLLLFIVTMDRNLLKKGFILPGIILGLFVSIKITSILFALPVILLFIFKNKMEWEKALRRIILISIAAILVFYIVNPDYWFAPFSRGKEFLQQTLTRRSWTPFTVFFNGTFYDYSGPFYYPFVMFCITTPLAHLVLLMTGLLVFAFDRKNRCDFKMIIIFTCFIIPFIILALPISPAHDGIRYLLPSLPFAACFMTIGLERLWAFIRSNKGYRPLKMIPQIIASFALLLLFASDLRNPARVPPFELSYYNKLVGGLSGAHMRGFETTYWWEIINEDVLIYLNNICKDSYVYFPISPTDYYFKHMIEMDKITFKPTRDLKKAEFMLIFGRPYVKYWEIRAHKKLKRLKRIPVTIWDISIDSIPLIQLYSIQDIGPKIESKKNI